MGQFPRDQTLHNLKIDEVALDQLSVRRRFHALDFVQGG